MKPTRTTIHEHRATMQQDLRAPRALVGFVLLLGTILLAGLAAGPSAFAFGSDSDDEDSGSDPTVGTLPMVGGGDQPFDQTITLRGDTMAVRGAIADAAGRGAYDTHALTRTDSWMRVYGDVRIELNLTSLAKVDLSLFAGYDGGGLRYMIETPAGAGSMHALAPGQELDLDPIRLLHQGLLDEPISVHAIHRDGTRTKTTLEYRSSDSTVVVWQDI